MPISIPVHSNDPHYTLTVPLDGREYTLELLWNAEATGWFLSVYTEGTNPVVLGLRLVADWALGRRHRYAGLPPGVLVIQDSTGASADPDRNSLGGRHRLLYFEASEVSA